MKILSDGIINSTINDKYGKRGSKENNISIPLKFSDYPAETRSFAIIIEDYDAIPVCGYDYIHWLVANVETDYLDENASIDNKYIIQGKNSQNQNAYTGMAPPDKPHNYDITVFALDTMLDIKSGFSYSELKYKMHNHILDQVNIKAKYDN